MKMKHLRFACGAILAVSISATAYAYSVVGEYNHGSTVQVELKCDSGSKARVTYYKNSREYCTASLSCSSSLPKAARWACGE